ncbi:hypothetical protein PLESTF_000964000 [Pleodorina starrii]|nr:hypothetical protein PLESTM_002009900 [Pleodorina starrii]GLC70353.1 hypothetical protein PLESTF_000964000 [Pleodorina starrii]
MKNTRGRRAAAAAAVVAKPAAPQPAAAPAPSTTTGGGRPVAVRPRNYCTTRGGVIGCPNEGCKFNRSDEFGEPNPAWGGTLFINSSQAALHCRLEHGASASDTFEAVFPNYKEGVKPDEASLKAPVRALLVVSRGQGKAADEAKDKLRRLDICKKCFDETKLYDNNCKLRLILHVDAQIEHCMQRKFGEKGVGRGSGFCSKHTTTIPLSDALDELQGMSDQAVDIVDTLCIWDKPHVPRQPAAEVEPQQAGKRARTTQQQHEGDDEEEGEGEVSQQADGVQALLSLAVPPSLPPTFNFGGGGSGLGAAPAATKTLPLPAPTFAGFTACQGFGTSSPRPASQLGGSCPMQLETPPSAGGRAEWQSGMGGVGGDIGSLGVRGGFGVPGSVDGMGSAMSLFGSGVPLPGGASTTPAGASALPLPQFAQLPPPNYGFGVTALPKPGLQAATTKTPATQPARTLPTNDASAASGSGSQGGDTQRYVAAGTSAVPPPQHFGFGYTALPNPGLQAATTETPATQPARTFSTNDASAASGSGSQGGDTQRYVAAGTSAVPPPQHFGFGYAALPNPGLQEGPTGTPAAQLAPILTDANLKELKRIKALLLQAQTEEWKVSTGIIRYNRRLHDATLVYDGSTLEDINEFSDSIKKVLSVEPDPQRKAYESSQRASANTSAQSLERTAIQQEETRRDVVQPLLQTARNMVSVLTELDGKLVDEAASRREVAEQMRQKAAFDSHSRVKDVYNMALLSLDLITVVKARLSPVVSKSVSDLEAHLQSHHQSLPKPVADPGVLKVVSDSMHLEDGSVRATCAYQLKMLTDVADTIGVDVDLTSSPELSARPEAEGHRSDDLGTVQQKLFVTKRSADLEYVPPTLPEGDGCGGV